MITSEIISEASKNFIFFEARMSALSFGKV